MERFEEMCRAYLNGSEHVKEAILNLLSEEEKETFLMGVGLYRLFTDAEYYNAMCQTVSEMVYNSLKN